MKKFDNVNYFYSIITIHEAICFSLNDVLLKRKDAILETSSNAHDSNKKKTILSFFNDFVRTRISWRNLIMSTYILFNNYYTWNYNFSLRIFSWKGKTDNLIYFIVSTKLCFWWPHCYIWRINRKRSFASRLYIPDR